VELLRSRRVRIFIASILVWGTARFGFDIDPAALDKGLELVMVLIGSFGLSGFGKEKTAQEIEAAKQGLLILGSATIPPPISSSTPPPIPSLPLPPRP
jgi:hypothetical protein